MPKIIRKETLNQTLLTKLLPKIHSGEIFNLNTNQIAQLLNISKATLYKVYPSKEDIYTNFIEGMIDFIKNDQIVEIPKDNKQYITDFDVLIDKLFSVSLLISPTFLKKLESDYPNLYNKTNKVLKQLEQNLEDYYHEQIKLARVNDINPKLLVIQQKATLQFMLNDQTIFKYEMNIKEFVISYYKLQKEIIFKDSKDKQEVSNKIINHLTEKINSIMLKY